MKVRWQEEEDGHMEEKVEEKEGEKEEEGESLPDCWKRNSVHQEEEAVETGLRSHLNERFTVIIIETFRETYRDNSSLAVRERKIIFCKYFGYFYCSQSGLFIDSEPLISGGKLITFGSYR